MGRIVLLLAPFWAAALMAQVAVPTPQTPPTVQEQIGVLIPMRDGVRLAADVFRPKGDQRCPAILVRTPYNRKASGVKGYRYYAERGYAVVIQDVRGCHASQGAYGDLPQEGPDGNDSINWIAAQPWSNGRVGMAGSSYLGMAQWWAAIQDNPHLITISPVFSGDDDYRDRYYSPGGPLQLEHRLLWLSENLTPPSLVRPTFGAYIDHLPLRSADVAATGVAQPIWRNALDHPSYDQFWRKRSIREQFSRLNPALPVLSMGGWFDNYAESDLDAFSRLSKRRVPIETWIGPWGHNPLAKFPTIDFGPEVFRPARVRQLDWYDFWLKKLPLLERNFADFVPSLHLFVMNGNFWREEREWPLARTRFTPIYLDSKGHANSSTGDGSLRWQPVRKSTSDQFTYDPKRPVPSIGGSLCCEPKIMPPGPLDQTPVERRPDVLVYTSAALAEGLEVTGPVRAVLYVSTSANDTDFTAKLIDVQPDGRPLLVTDGIQRLRYRLSLASPVFVKRDTPYQISVDAGVTSWVFGPGHRIRLEVSSSNFPRFDRSLNSFRPNADEFKLTKARQTVYHKAGYPSAIILPVIPRGSESRANESRRPEHCH